MPEKNTWMEDTDRLILFADIMGFKDRVARTKHTDLKNELIAFKDAWVQRMKPFQTGDHLRFSQYSDSIVIVVNGVNEQMLNLLTKASICLMQYCLSNGFPIKGAIAKGVFTYDEARQLFFGQPLIDAYLLQEEIKYYGIVVHHTVENLIKNSSKVKDLYSKVSVPLDKGGATHFHLRWHRLDKKFSSKGKGFDWQPLLEKLEEQVSGKPRVYVDNTRSLLEKDMSPTQP